MWKRYVAVYNGEAGGKSIFLDIITKILAVVEIEMTSYRSTILSGFLGVTIYYVFGNVLFKSPLSPATLIAIILVIGCLGGTFFNLLNQIDYFIYANILDRDNICLRTVVAELIYLT